LTVTIQNASLGTWEEVTGTDGSEAWRHPGNSDLGAAENTLTVTKAADGTYSVAVLDGETYSGTTVGEALQKAGFGVTDLTVYTCVWTLNEETEACTLEGGEHRVFQIYATAKNTFQMMSSDWPNEYPSDSTLTIPNTAKVLTPTGKTVATVSTSKTVKRESRIDKTVYRDGQLLYDSPTAADGDILEYHLDFTHYGTGGYQDLPMVDDLYGSQYLLVPVASNPDMTGLETHGDYYILTEGTYQNVVVGVDDEGKALTAATITVQQATEETEVSVGGIEYSYTGLHTQIKWYFPDLEGGNYRSTVTYQALVSTALTGVNYTIGNVVWMNDREGARIYDTLWGGGTIIDFQKDIVTEKGSSPALDVLDEDGYSLVEAGEKVTYRLTLENPGTGYFKLNGTDLADALPETLGVFEWEKDVNVTDFRVEIVGEGVEAIGLENWNLGNRYLNLLGERQYILWSDASITFTEPSTVYLYFTLTHPEDSDDSDTWSRYAAAVGGGMLNNTMYVYRFPSMVTHGLRESGQVMLQKGVHGMYYYATNNTYWYVESGNSRQFYNNRDSKSRAVAYYVTLYNDGNKRLYLDDLYDQLPQGFTYKVMLADGNITNTTAATVRNTITTVGGTNQGTYPLADWSASDVVFRSAGITATKTADGVKFSIGKGSGLYAVKYDEEQQQYYLDKGEAIVFGYLCDIGTSVQTETSATNTIAMPYTDYLNTGVVVVGRDSLLVNAPDSEQFVDYNDGSRMTKSNSQVSEDYGFENSDQQTWLVSDVTVSRGGIIPGVTKYAESYTNTGGITASYVNSVGPFDKVNWRVRLHNSGTLSLADYTFTDIMPAPYTIEGPVTFTIYDGNGNSVFSATACTFPTNRTGGEESITVTRAYTAGGNVTVPFDGTESSVWAVQTPLYLSLSRDESGNEIMQLNFQWANLAIPEGGYMDVCFSSRNPTNEYANTVYTNQAILTPNAQEFTTVQQGSMVRDEDGRPVSVNNSAPITVSFGYHTSSEKRVTETADTTNTAVSSNQENNVILLSSADSDFIYTFTVKNETEAAMTKLILIDNLPEPDDHSPFHTAALRGSEFQVDLADNPNFEVTVTTEDGTNYQLDSKYYSVEYSTDNDFGGPESEDWTGESAGTTAKWTNDSNGARAIRVIIRDESATQIPAGADISITFHAKVSGQAEAGGIAWNSFGYHYALKGVATELEAMPLVVGVQIPSIPALEKQLVDSNGEPVNAPKDSSFSFLAYEGAALENSYDTAEALIEALIADGRDYKQFDLTVEAGETTSGSVFLSDWNWKEGQQYTIVELPCDNSYAFHSFYGSRTAAYTFTYDPTETLTILCKNTFQQWKLSLTKVDGDSQGDDRQPLPGAVFALYSPNEKDQQEIPDEFSSLIIESVIEQGDQTWYLANVAASDEDGKLDFGDLMRDNYYLLEVKAPDGYNLNDPAGQIVYRDGAEQGIYTLTVANFAGYKLPESGGTGTTMIYIGGLLAMTLACFLLYRKNKRGKEDIASS